MKFKALHRFRDALHSPHLHRAGCCDDSARVYIINLEQVLPLRTGLVLIIKKQNFNF